MTQLYLIEQAIAQRCGPFLVDQAAAGTTTTVTIVSQQTTLPVGDPWTGLYVLRRGIGVDTSSPYGRYLPSPVPNIPGVAQTGPVTTTSGAVPVTFLEGALVPGFVATDRVRRIAAPIDRSTGTITVDRAWTNAPISGELIELHYLDPINELQVAALAGLTRCFLVDRASVATTGQAAERDLTALVPWITQLGQIYEIGYIYPGIFYIERPLPWWKEFLQNGHIWLTAMPDPFPNNLLITARHGIDSMGTVELPLSTTNIVQPIIDATAASPIVCTTPSGNKPYFQTGDLVTIAGVFGGGADINGTWQVGTVTSQTFELVGSIGVTHYGSTALNAPAIGTATLVYTQNAAALAQTSDNHGAGGGMPYTSMTITPPTFTVARQPLYVGQTVRVFEYPGGILPPVSVGQWTITAVTGDVTQQGTVTLSGGPGFDDGNGGFLEIVRPAFVAGQAVPQNPVVDFTDYPVSLDYATAWGVVAAWQRFPYRLAPGAQAGRIPTKEEAAAEATNQAAKNFNPPPRRQQMPQPFVSWQTDRL